MVKIIIQTGRSRLQLKVIPRVGFQGINLKAAKLFKVKPEEMRVAKQIALRLVPQVKAKLTRITQELGFKIETNSAIIKG